MPEAAGWPSGSPQGDLCHKLPSIVSNEEGGSGLAGVSRHTQKTQHVNILGRKRKKDTVLLSRKTSSGIEQKGYSKNYIGQSRWKIRKASRREECGLQQEGGAKRCKGKLYQMGTKKARADTKLQPYNLEEQPGRRDKTDPSKRSRQSLHPQMDDELLRSRRRIKEKK